MDKVKASSEKRRLGCDHNPVEAKVPFDLQADRVRIIHLLEQQLAHRPGTRPWQKALEHFERAVSHQLRLEDDLLRIEHLEGYREGDRGAEWPCADVAKLRGRLPQLFHEAREASPDTAFMAYLKLAATLRRWAGCMEARA